MGRRKIEIRAIKDDRNRSVTFLKRKGGLFKKAHELSVLCSVDVAVIIFGHNKKLYEFSSGDINETLRRYQYYGPPHEHKGPGDFKNKGGDDDDDDDDEDEPMHRDDSIPPQHHMMPQQIPQHNSFQHVRAPGQSASPPMVNGMFPQRNGTPQPSHMGSRPSSRNTVRRTSSNLVPMQHPHPSPAPSQNGFAYTPNPPIYQPQPNGAPQPSPQPSQYSFQSHTPQPQHQSPYLHQEPQHQPPTQAPPRDNTLHPPPNPVPRTSPQPQQGEFRQPEQNMTPPQIKHLSSNQKSRSIFTPIDEGGSVLAQHFFGAPDPPRTQHAIKRESPGDIKPPLRTAPIMTTSRPSPPPRPASGGSFRPPTRSDTNGSKSGARPKLNLTIPSENSEDEASTSPNVRSAVNSANPVNGQHHGIVLPPPSPSASAVLSAGATGPPNPFARPPPPTSNANQGLGVTTQNSGAFNDNKNTNNNNNNLETPISALPSRYMDRDLLASPGGIFGAWGDFGGGILPSPNVNTPAERGAPNGWSRSDASDEQKRKGDELQPEGKRVKT